MTPEPEPEPGSGSCCGSAKTEEKESALSNALWHHGRRGGCRCLPQSACNQVVGKGLYESGIGSGEDFGRQEK